MKPHVFRCGDIFRQGELNELRTLRVGDLSFGDVTFLVLRAQNENNRTGSSVPLRSDLAGGLRDWTRDRPHDAEVFNVPAGLLRIMDRDLIAAGIDKIDERGRRVHLHALRHSTGTHLSAANVSPRTAQSVMRHSDIALTMNTYTDERLLDAAGAVAMLPDLPIGPSAGGVSTGRRQNSKASTPSSPAATNPKKSVAPFVAPTADNSWRNCQDLADEPSETPNDGDTKKPRETLVFAGFGEVEPKGVEPSTSALRTQRSPN